MTDNDPTPELHHSVRSVALIRRRRWLMGMAILSVAIGAILLRLKSPGTNDLADRLTGEWEVLPSLKFPEDMVVVWTFKSNGIIRVDAIDAQSRKTVRELPLVGRWQVDGGEVVCTWESWQATKNRPTENEERLLVRSISENELVVVVTGCDGRRVADEQLLRYKRFPGWSKEPDHGKDQIMDWFQALFE